MSATKMRLCLRPSAILCFKLLAEDPLECNGVSSELGNTFAELLHSHLILVEAEAKRRLIVDVGLSLDAE